MKNWKKINLPLVLALLVSSTLFARDTSNYLETNPTLVWGKDTATTVQPVKVMSDGTTVMRFPSDSSRLRSGEITLPATIGNLHTHTFSDTAIGFTLKPRSVAIRYAVNATVAEVATDNDGTSTGASLAVGGIANADTLYTHTLPEGASRTLTLKGTTASPVVELVEF